MDKTAVLIPCYNEATSIASVIKDFKKVLPEAVIYVYDNNSTDGTADIAKEAGAEVRFERLQGKGNVIRRMFREVDAEVYVMVDGDNTYGAESAPEMVRLIKEGADMVVGDRLSSTYYTENKRPFHNAGNSFMCKAVNTLFGSKIPDMLTGFRAFSYEFVKTFPIISKGFDIETEMTIHAIDKNLRVEGVVVDYRDREGSESKLNTVSDGIKVIGRMLKLYKTYKPMGFFSIIAGVLFVVAMCFFIPILVEYFRTGLVLKFPTLIVCGFMTLAAIISVFTGTLLANINTKNRQDFELNFIKAHDRFNDLK
ncbi:MAG: glycosyltransferase [Parasporobacterium sp.]|nr:glycosyltransferase [Parasporobacterium sp.]